MAIDAPYLDTALAKLNAYRFKKDQLVRDNLVTGGMRGKASGLFNAFLPPVSIIAWLRNHSAHRGIIFKLRHPSEPYEQGERTIFPNLRRWWGARFKDVRTGRSSRENSHIRMLNMGYAQSLQLTADFLKARPSLASSRLFYAEVYDQFKIKSARKEFDGYYKVLEKLIKKADPKHIEYAQHAIHDAMAKGRYKTYGEYLKAKAHYLDHLAEHTIPADYVRTQDYRFITAKALTPAGDTEALWTHLNLKYKPVPEQLENTALTPTHGVFDFDRAPIIPLRKGLVMADKLMHIKLDPSIYKPYTIRGIERDTGKLVGKNNEVLPDGWYQFVMLAELDANGKPQIRYFPCGEKRTGTPVLQQNPKRATGSALTNDGGYLIQSPVGFSLKYDKYTAHSEIAGGLPLSSGGAFLIKNGKLAVIEDSSGHYAIPEDAPDKHIALKYALRAFQFFGVDARDTILERWKPFHGFSKLAKKAAGMFLQPFQTKITKEEKLSAALAELRPPKPGERSPAQILAQVDAGKLAEEILSPTTVVDAADADLPAGTSQTSHQQMRQSIPNTGKSARRPAKAAETSSQEEAQSQQVRRGQSRLHTAAVANHQQKPSTPNKPRPSRRREF